jgi:hypothetical protein
MNNKQTKRLILVLTDKGGTGKSLFTRGVTDYLIRKQLQHKTLIVDGDGEVGQLLQFYKHTGVISAQIIDEQKRDQFMEILESKQPLIVVDLPAAAISNLAKLEEEIDFFQVVKDYGYRLTLCNVMSPFKASVRSVKAMIDLAGEHADYVVVKNRFFGDDADFHLYESGQGKKALAKHNGLEISMPKICTGVLAELDSKNIPFWQAVNDEQLKLAYRCRVNKWQKEFDEQLHALNLTEHLQQEAIDEPKSISSVA